MSVMSHSVCGGGGGVSTSINQPAHAATPYTNAPTRSATLVPSAATAEATNVTENCARLRGTGVSDNTGARSSREHTWARCAYSTVPVSAAGTDLIHAESVSSQRNGAVAIPIDAPQATIMAGQNMRVGPIRSTKRPVTHVAIVVSKP